LAQETIPKIPWLLYIHECESATKRYQLSQSGLKNYLHDVEEESPACNSSVAAFTVLKKIMIKH
jgi:hypothetical protein